MASKTSIYEKRIIQEIKQTPDEYLPNLLQIVHFFKESVLLKPSAQSFQQGWKEILDGETYPISSLWNGIDAK